MHHVHFFHPILPYIREPEVARDGIEAEAPRVAETVRPDFRSRVVGPETDYQSEWRRLCRLRGASTSMRIKLSEQQLQVLACPLGPLCGPVSPMTM